MRIELKCTSSCPSSMKLKERLEDIIAEERLPLAVEIVESAEQESPIVRISVSGADSDIHEDHEIRSENHLSSERQFLDNLRSIVLQKWHDHAIHPLSHLR